MNTLLLRYFPLSPYEQIWEAMKSFTETRDDKTPDECWIGQHCPVYTQGQAGKKEHLLDPKAIPVVHSDRGGQVTYHGPGQLIFYVLLDLKRRSVSLKHLIDALQQSGVDMLQDWGIPAHTQPHAPGIYVEGSKIASLGLKIRKGCCYHGLSLNVDMDLEPFNGINPCGALDLNMTQLSSFRSSPLDEVASILIQRFQKKMNYDQTLEITSKDLLTV